MNSEQRLKLWAERAVVEDALELFAQAERVEPSPGARRIDAAAVHRWMQAAHLALSEAHGYHARESQAGHRHECRGSSLPYAGGAR